jgi:hypothetical protein
MEDRSEAIARFSNALEQNGFRLKNQELSTSSDPNEYRDLLLSMPSSAKDVTVFTTRSDVVKLCRAEETRLEKMMGAPNKIDDDKMAAVFIWDQTVGVVPDIPYPIQRWTRYFNANIDAPCLVCMESGKKRTMCSNCASIVCLECDAKVGKKACLGCTRSMTTFIRSPR